MTIGRFLSRRLDDINLLATDGFKKRAKLMLQDMKKDWIRLNDEIGIIFLLPDGEKETYIEASD